MRCRAGGLIRTDAHQMAYQASPLPPGDDHCQSLAPHGGPVRFLGTWAMRGQGGGGLGCRAVGHTKRMWGVPRGLCTGVCMGTAEGPRALNRDHKAVRRGLCCADGTLGR